VTSYGPLPVTSVLALAAGLAEALAAVHAAGLVHRDLKPSNVLLASDGPRVIDFGIARAADTTTLTDTGQSIGSPGYLSPEQAVGTEAGPPSDIFSLGAVLAFAASGNGPFGAGSMPALVYRVVHEPPALDGVPAELRPLIGRCLVKEPADRPAASDLLAELTDVHPGAPWLPERITAALAGFAAPAPTQTVPGAATSDPAPAAGSAHAATSSPPPGGGPAPDASGPRRLPWLRRRLLVPVAAAVAVVAAVAVLLASTLGGSGGSGGANALAGGRPTAPAGALAAAAHSVTPTTGTPSPLRSTPARPAPSPSRKAVTKKTVRAQAPPAKAQAAPSVVIVTAPATSYVPPKPAAKPPGPKSIAGTYSFSRQVITCTYATNCGGTPLVITFDCSAASSCVALWGGHGGWGPHTVSFNGTTMYVSALDVAGPVTCRGIPMPASATIDVNVLAWSAGTGGAVRTPTQMQGAYDYSNPAEDGCHASETQQTISYG
jgi:hypothetical protein